MMTKNTFCTSIPIAFTRLSFIRRYISVLNTFTLATNIVIRERESTKFKRD
jgi:hypothetical protein